MPQLKKLIISTFAAAVICCSAFGQELKPGDLIWEFRTESYVASSPAIGADGTVYVGSDDRNVYALDGKIGAKKWKFRTVSYVASSPAIGADGTVYVGSKDHKVHALGGKTGAKQWQFETGVDVYSSPAIGADGTVYAGSRDQKVYALDGKTGGKRWQFQTGGWVYSSPAIGANGTVYVGSYDNKVYALDGRGPRWNPTLNMVTVKQWEFETGGWVYSSPSIGADGTVYVGSRDNKVYALDGKTGAKKWEFRTGADVDSSPAIGADGTVYVGSRDYKVYAFKTSSTGPADSSWPMFSQNAQRTGRAPSPVADKIKIYTLTKSASPFTVSFESKSGSTYLIEASHDLKKWGEIGEVQGTGSSVKFTDPRLPIVPFKRNYFRVKLVE